MLPALLLAGLVALLGAAALVRRRQRSLDAEPTALTAAPVPAPRVLAAAVAPAATISGTVPPPPRRDDPLDALDLLLAELESATVRIDGADELDERAVVELEGLAARFEAAAESFAAR